MPSFLESIREAVGDTLFCYAVSPAIKILVLLFLCVLPLITYLVLIERKVLGFMQARVGPNRVGPWGMLQPIADVMKLLVKEDTMPHQAVKWAFILAPLPGGGTGVHHPLGDPLRAAARASWATSPGSSPTSTPACCSSSPWRRSASTA